MFLERVLRSLGVRTGLTRSPHIRSWGERIAINGAAITDERLLLELDRLHRLAPTVTDVATLRFFDLVTLAAAVVFAEAGVEVAVYEAGIGGRLDATHLVAAPLVVLTSIGIDHEELLGMHEVDALREKIGVAGRGATVVAAGLHGDLRREADLIAERDGLDLRYADDLSGSFLSRNAALAMEALRNAPFDLGEVPDDMNALLADGIPGRMERIEAQGVDVILDAAHNPQAWSELSELLPPRYIAVVSISRDRSAAALAASLRHAHRVVVTQAWPDRSFDSMELGAVLGRKGLRVDVVSEPSQAIADALHLARSEQLPLVVFGSTYLLPHALVALGR